MYIHMYFSSTRPPSSPACVYIYMFIHIHILITRVIYVHMYTSHTCIFMYNQDLCWHPSTPRHHLCVYTYTCSYTYTYSHHTLYAYTCTHHTHKYVFTHNIYVDINQYLYNRNICWHPLDVPSLPACVYS